MMKKRKMGPNEKSSRKPSANPASAPSPAKEEEEEGKKKERREKRSRKEMNFTYASLDPVPVTKPGKHSAEEKRTHQGIPGIEQLDSGRIFAVWYAGGKSECRENYVVMSISDDDGATWSGTVAVADPPHPDVRAFDSTCWISPEGRFHWFWAQGCGGTDGSWENADGIAGVWFSVLENPEDDPGNFRFTPPRRISNGVMMNKPTVLSDGSWALPCSVWTGPFRRHESLDVRQGAMMLLSPDRGEKHLKSAAESPWTGSKEERPSTNTCSLNSAPDAFSAVSGPEKESRKVSPTMADAHGALRVFPRRFPDRIPDSSSAVSVQDASFSSATIPPAPENA